MYQWPLIHDLPTNEQHPEAAGHPVASSSKSILQAEAPQSGAEIPQYRVVPQRLHKPDSLLPYTRPGFEGIGSVRFDRVNSTVGFGVGLTGLLDGSACLNDQDKCIFQGSGEAQLTFRILWPSYPHFDFGRIINLKYTEEGKTTVHHVTRLELARIIAICFDEFVDQCRGHKLEPVLPSGWPGAQDCHVGQGGLELEDLLLVQLYYVDEHTWQAEFRYAH